MSKFEITKVRSSRPEVFCKKGALRNFTKFTGEHLRQCCVINSTYILELSRHLTIFVYVLRVKQYVKYRSSRPEVFCKEGNLKNFAKSQESICFLITLQACFYDYQFFSVLRGMLQRRRGEIHPKVNFFFLRYKYLSPRAENWKFPPQGEMDILTFLHDILNGTIL